MSEKKVASKFTILFSRTDPAHLQVAEILNSLKRRGKAEYIVNAVLHYSSCEETPEIKYPARFDEKIIEAAVNKILRDREETYIYKRKESVPVGDSVEAAPPTFGEEIDFDEAMMALGEDGFNAIVGALDMFRKG